jgi:hypothetical protein
MRAKFTINQSISHDIWYFDKFDEKCSKNVASDFYEAADVAIGTNIRFEKGDGRLPASIGTSRWAHSGFPVLPRSDPG